MSTMPPISDSRSAPLMLLSSPAASIWASQARRSCLGRGGISFEARAPVRESSVDCMKATPYQLAPSSCPASCRASTSSAPRETRMAGTSPAMTEWVVREPIISLAVEDALEPLRRDRQLGDRARHADRGFDRGGDHGADRGDAALAGALDAKRV